MRLAPYPPLRHRLSPLVPLLVVLAVVGCDGSAPTEAATGTTVRVLVRDINIREAGVDCAGTGPYLHLHNRAPFRVVDGAGQTLTEGSLPPGKSVRTFTEDLGVDRVPTYCEFAIPVSVPSRDRYGLVVDDRPAIDLTVDPAGERALVAVVPS